MKLTGQLTVELEGVGKVTLTPKHFIGGGGEGSAYLINGKVVKLYTDTDKMRRDGMVDKLKMLMVLDHPLIVAPKGLVMRGGHAIGYWMEYADGSPLVPFCTNGFRKRENITNLHAAAYVEKMRMVMEFVHGHKALMIDPNLRNWMVDLNKGGRSGPKPLSIDVDSFAIGRFGAKAIMASIMDHHTQGFNALSDWFSLAVVSWEVLVGIHPYRGRLDAIKLNAKERAEIEKLPLDDQGLAEAEALLAKRMLKNASVFTSGVVLNAAVRTFDVVPARWLPWYEAVLQNGERSIMPALTDPGMTPAKKAARVMRMVSQATGMLVYNKLIELVNDPIIRVFPTGVVLTESGKLYEISSKRLIGTAKSRECELVTKEGHWVLADWENGDLDVSTINQKTLVQLKSTTLMLEGKKLVRYGERLFVVIDDNLAEVEVTLLGKPILSGGKMWGVLTNSTRWFDGCGIQDAMGATFVVLPWGSDACNITRVKELDGLKPVAAKAGPRFISVIGLDKKGQYQKIELTFDQNYTGYQVWRGGADGPDLNMAIKDNGTVATIVEDTKIVIFIPGGKPPTKIEDKDITTEMALSNWGNTIVYVLDGALWSIASAPKP